MPNGLDQERRLASEIDATPGYQGTGDRRLIRDDVWAVWARDGKIEERFRSRCPRDWLGRRRPA